MERKRILEEIYDKAANGSEYMGYVEREVSRQLETLLSVYKGELTEEEYIKLEEIVVGGAVIAEKVAFIAGICYGMKLSWEGLS